MVVGGGDSNLKLLSCVHNCDDQSCLHETTSFRVIQLVLSLHYQNVVNTAKTRVTTDSEDHIP